MKLLGWIIVILLFVFVIGPIMETQVFAWIVVVVIVARVAVEAGSRN